MKYKFDEVIDRRNSDSSKWNVGDHELPMGLADMDFKVDAAIIEAIQKKAEFGIFGYSDVSPHYFEAYQSWWKRRHHFAMNTEWMVFCSGVVPAISSIIRKLTTAGENVLLMAPVYNIFYNSIINNGRFVISNDLVYENGTYKIDFEDLEKKLANPQTTMMILCNPHNPIGKIWDKETLARIGALCEKYHVIVISDEIHCDICEPGISYTPFASVNETCKNISITALSASKAFNLAGLQASCIVIPDPFLRHKVTRGLNTDEIAEPNVFAMDAIIAAFEKSEPWLDEVNAYINDNKQAAYTFIKEQLPFLHIVESQATYLLWIDCNKVSDNSDVLCAYLKEKTGLIVSSGSIFSEVGKSFIRINIACPQSKMLEGLKRLKDGIDGFMMTDTRN